MIDKEIAYAVSQQVRELNKFVDGGEVKTESPMFFLGYCRVAINALNEAHLPTPFTGQEAIKTVALAISEYAGCDKGVVARWAPGWAKDIIFCINRHMDLATVG